jgi:threonine dehydratase
MPSAATPALPVTLDDVRAAHARIRPFLDVCPTPARRARGVVGATTGNHGLGLAYAGACTGTRVTICVPRGNNPAKNAAIRALGAELVEAGDDYEGAIATAQRLAAERGATLVHGVNDRDVIAGAGTLTLELLEQAPDLDALIIAIGGGSQAVGALAVARGLGHPLAIWGAQAAGASAQHDSWHARERRTTARVATFAEGVGTRATYDLTWPALRDGLAGFVTVTDDEIADAMRQLVAIARQLPEGAAGVGLAMLRRHAAQFAGRTVGIVFCGGNQDAATLARVLGSTAGAAQGGAGGGA